MNTATSSRAMGSSVPASDSGSVSRNESSARGSRGNSNVISGEIEQWADSCLLLHRPDVDESKEDELARLIVAKNRWGELGHIPLVPDLKHSRFLWMDNRRSG